MDRRLELEQLARWWSQAKEEARWLLLRRTIAQETDTPPLSTLQLAIYIAEAEAREIDPSSN